MSKSSICVVDDSSALLSTYQIIFESLGEILTFSTPQKFLTYLSDHPNYRPDLLITDLSMPGMDGLEMVNHAQSAGIFCPTLMVSGHVSKQVAIQAMEVGVWRLLEKPVSPKTLVISAEELLREHEHHKLRTEIRETVAQLREVFAAFQMLCLDELDLHALGTKMEGMDSNHESVSLGQALSDLEARLEKLTRAEIELEKTFKKSQLARAS